MNFFDWITTSLSKAPTLEPQSHIWDPETVTMQQPTAPEPPSTKTSILVGASIQYCLVPQGA
ncbi:similar to An12g10350 [Aspergillus luchuensis]|uniref:Similar to An12g10350 n=1 Tax=Aspergillus kawachii TaxID=1069201 RepID=A0A146F4S0_ASPKA|nr:similar to An12g10350 [Aspergillus luchuensis]